jgi:hypothetical protein
MREAAGSDVLNKGMLALMRHVVAQLPVRLNCPNFRGYGILGQMSC